VPSKLSKTCSNAISQVQLKSLLPQPVKSTFYQLNIATLARTSLSHIYSPANFCVGLKVSKSHPVSFAKRVKVARFSTSRDTLFMVSWQNVSLIIMLRLFLVLVKTESEKDAQRKGSKHILKEKRHQEEEKLSTRSVITVHVASDSSCRISKLAQTVVEDYSEVVESRKSRICPDEWKKNILNEKCHSTEGKWPSVNHAHATKPSNQACRVSQLAQADLDLFFR